MSMRVICKKKIVKFRKFRKQNERPCLVYSSVKKGQSFRKERHGKILEIKNCYTMSSPIKKNDLHTADHIIII